jgi:hypothetical protein
MIFLAPFLQLALALFRLNDLFLEIIEGVQIRFLIFSMNLGMLEIF